MSETKVPLFVCGKDNRPMVKIPAGEFLFGEDQEKVETKEYFIDLYPVTNADYKKFIEATGHAEPASWRRGNWPEGKENHPVVEVNWESASAYAEWAGKRLPTGEEWEKAARGTDGRTCRGATNSTATSATPSPAIPPRSGSILRRATALTAARIWPATYGNGSAAANPLSCARRCAAATGWTARKKRKLSLCACTPRTVKIPSLASAALPTAPNR